MLKIFDLGPNTNTTAYTTTARIEANECLKKSQFVCLETTFGLNLNRVGDKLELFQDDSTRAYRKVYSFMDSIDKYHEPGLARFDVDTKWLPDTFSENFILSEDLFQQPFGSSDEGTEINIFF